MDSRDIAPRAPPKTSAGLDYSEEMLAELDEPPDEVKHPHRSSYFWTPPYFKPAETNALPPQWNRRESLLTRQLHSEPDHTDDEQHPPTRALSTQSTMSNPSTASTAELTSDDGHSVASPAISPPLAPTHMPGAFPSSEKSLDQRVKIVGQDVTSNPAMAPVPEKTVEANLGRKRCITFACKGKQEDKPKQPPTPEPEKSEVASPPKRKCMLKFACPTRSSSDVKSVEKPAKRAASPPPPIRRPSASAKAEAFRTHRGSDSTVTHASPKASRKPSMTRSPSVREESSKRPSIPRKYSNDSDSSDNEATRFHEFGTSEEEPENWIQESTCHRSRLTLTDVLKKENVIRQACEEAEEEVVEEEDEEEVEELEDEAEELAEIEDDDLDAADEDEEEDEESDEGFHSDDEDGFANSDSDNDSEYEWWKPGPSTAATSVEHLDRLAIVNSQPPRNASVGSASSGEQSVRSLRRRMHKKHSKTPAMDINRALEPELPDSTDFVCGTLDEDRPIEQAYINRKKMKEAAKHKARPQDIDPTFPTSDPEMDEEDDDDVDDQEASDEEDDFMHGTLEEIHGTSTLRRTSSNHKQRGRSNSHRSPPPPKHLSPPPSRRHHSPPPSKRHHSSPQPKKRVATKSPAPPLTKRGTARSPPPRKLFGHSPRRAHSPAPGHSKRMMTSPPNSPTSGAPRMPAVPTLASRPRLQHTASLPRGGGFILSQLAELHAERHRNEDAAQDDSDGAATAVEIPKRGAIDIVKGLEKKRRLRKEKLHQKLCAKQAAKGEKTHRVKPGKGCERMREVGLGLQDYKGKAEHILSL